MRVLATTALMACLIAGCGDGGSAVSVTPPPPPVKCMDSGGDTKPAPEYVGLTESDVEAAVERDGGELRVLGREDKCLGQQDDFRPSRVNVHLVDGRVAAAVRY